MTDRELAQRLLELLGGTENVLSNAACMTRRRVGVKDVSKVDVAGIKATDGVMGLVEDQTMQVVLGPARSTRCSRNSLSSLALLRGLSTMICWRRLRRIRRIRKQNIAISPFSVS